MIESSEFKSITPIYKAACNKIIDNNGDCTEVECVIFPFYYLNRVDEKIMDMCLYGSNLKIMQKYFYSKRFLEFIGGKNE